MKPDECNQSWNDATCMGEGNVTVDFDVGDPAFLQPFAGEGAEVVVYRVSGTIGLIQVGFEVAAWGEVFDFVEEVLDAGEEALGRGVRGEVDAFGAGVIAHGDIFL